MKKLVSICFLSILFSVFSVQAQRDCCFQLFNPSADTMRNIANLPNGDLPLNHTMNNLVFGATDVYDLMFSDENCLGIDYETGKVSIETELWLDGENVLDGQHDLSRFCDIKLQTSYNELHWLGTPLMLDNRYEYPGAIEIFPGTYEISNVAFDYFFFKFLVNTNSRLVVKWNQVFQDAVLIVKIYERIHGTNNELYWDEGQRLNIGGHQSHRGRLLASDTITTRSFIEQTTIIKDCDPVTVGKPEFTMDTTGIYKIAYVDTGCGYRIDSVITYDYTHYVHPTTPTLSDSSFNYCQKVPAEPIVLPTEPNPALADHADQIVAYWSVYGKDFEYMPSFTPITDTTAGTYEFYVKRHDNLWGCESEIDTFHITINQIPAGPVVPEADRVQEYCVNDNAAQLVYNGVLPTGMQVLWGTNPDEVNTTLAPTPTTTDAGTQYYYLRIQDMNSVNECVSADYDSIIVNVYANPVVAISADKDTLCYNAQAVLSANPTNLTSYQWKMNDVEISGANDTTYTYINNVVDTTTQRFTVYVTEAHPEVTCHATSDEFLILAYPEIGAPTFVSGETTVCGPQEITLTVANGQHASTSTWYAADKTTILAQDTTTYTATYSANTTLYVSSSNDFGCETEIENWLQINITVNDIPHITLSADNNGEVCAESELIIRSAVDDSTSKVYTYAWTSNPAATLTPADADTTTFVAATTGTYKVALFVIDANGCTNTDTIEITVDTLPIITAEVNYNVFDNDYCVDNNGKIIFTTPDYVNYSIDNGATWQEEKAFEKLAANTYYLVVENANGCRNHANKETIIDAPATRVLTDSVVANKHCAEPYSGQVIAHITATPNGRTEATPKTYEYTLKNASKVWGPQADSVFTKLVNGTYTLVVENTTTGCVDSIDVTVPYEGVLPTGKITCLDFICFGDTARVAFVPDSADVVFQTWTYVGPATPELTDPIKDLQSFTLKNFPAGKHTFTAHFIDTVTKCVNEETKTIRVIGVNINLHQISPAQICEYDSVMINCEYFPDDATTDTIRTYKWYAKDYTQISQDTIKVVPSVVDNRVSVVATDNHNCQSTKYIDLKVNALPDIILTGAVEYCQNSFTNITVSSDSTLVAYKWTLDDNVVSDSSKLNVALSQDTVAVVTITDIHSCKNDSSIVINTVEVPGKPIITPAVQYFCAASDISVVPAQAEPQIGTLVWTDDKNPNVLQVAGNYSAVFDTVHSASLTCTSDTAKVEVKVTGVPTATVTIKYNDESTPSDSTARCYVETPTDTLHVNVAPVAHASATDTLNYTYTLNGVDTTANMILTHIIADSTYVDTIGISARHVHPDGNVCTWDTTIYYHFTVNPLPVAPTNFPTAHNNVGDPTIFYCEGAAPISYSFNIPTDVTAKYFYGDSVNVATQPDSAYTGIKLVLTSEYGCVDTFKYDIVEIATPTITVTRKSDDSYCQYDVFQDTIQAMFNTFSPADSSIFDWNLLSRTVNREVAVGLDTVHHTFSSVDTMAIVNAAVVYANGDYSATCYIAHPDTIDIDFISAPTKPALLSSTPGYHTIDTATYCAGSPVAITKANFTSTSDSIVIYSAGVATATITTNGSFDVVAYSKLAPYCPSDTLKFVLIENRKPEVPTDLFPTDKYNDTVYYCSNSSASYEFTKAHPADEFTYATAGSSSFSATKPTTAGSYTIRVTDTAATTVANACYTDTTYKIKKVNMPDYDFSKPVVSTAGAAWVDTNICFTNSQYIGSFKRNVKRLHTRLPEVKGHFDVIWNGDTIENRTYDFVVTGDTLLTFVYSEYDTVGSVGYGVACPYWNSDTIAITYFNTLAKPVYTGTTSFCAGDSVVISASNFSITYGADTALYTNPALPKTYTDNGSMKAVAYYGDFTACHSDTTTITITKNALPTVSITPNDPTICKGDTATLTATGATTYVWSTGETTSSIKVTDSIQYVVTGTDANNCSNTNTTKVNFYPGFEVKMSNDTLVCNGQPVNVTATISPIGNYSYTWFKDGVKNSIGTASSVGTLDYGLDIPAESAIIDGVPVPTLYAIEVIDDAHHCKSVYDSNVVAVTSTDRPQFEFREVGGTESIRSLDAHVGDATSFDMYIHQNCWNPETRVFVDFQIYKGGVPMTDAELANTIDVTRGVANTSYSFDLTQNAPALHPLHMTSSNYNKAADFFPGSEFLDNSGYPFDWFYMHFIDNRKITVDLGAWKPASAGTYTISYAVIVAGPEAATNGTLYKDQLKVGGHGAHTNLIKKDTIAFDYITIYVDPVSASGEGNEDITSITTLDPATSVDMKVYPNPANVTVNVAVAGVKGKTNVQVFDMSGKAVISTQVNVENDGQIISLPVDNFAQGMYFIKLVNGDAMMTKKLVIKR